MRFGFKKLALVGGFLLSVGLAFSLVGCGSASNNDQGTAFTFIGWFESTPKSGATTLPTGLTRIDVPISDTVGTETAGDSGVVGGFAGVQNNLSGEFIRLQRIFHTYFIEGAGAQPPATSYAMGGVVGPAVVTSSDATGAGGTGFDSSLPPSFSDGSLGNRTFAGTPLVTPDILSWINLNRGSLPETPFTMIVTSHIVGITSSGNQLETNEIDFPIVFTADVIITPSEPTVTDAGADPGAAGG